MATDGWNAQHYSNPRMADTIEDWPIGSKRCTAVFTIECHPKRGERAIRSTVGAPKKLTYSRKVRIIDGDDGRIYIAELTDYGHISIMRGDMKYQHEVIFPTTHDAEGSRFTEALELFR